MTLILFLIMTAIGTAFISLSSQENVLSRQEINKKQALYLAEGGIAKALWRINKVSEELAGFSNDSQSVTYDSTLLRLVSTGYRGSFSRSIAVTLYDDHAFKHILSFGTQLDTSNYTLISCSDHELQAFDDLPEVDLLYNYSICDYYYDSTHVFMGDMPSGIHYVKGNVTMKNTSQLNGTMVTEGSIKFVGNVEIHAQQIPDTSLYYPAVIAMDTTQAVYTEVDGNPNLIIYGAIYCYGFISFKGEYITGPIIADHIELKSGVEVNDGGCEDYYYFPPGFINPNTPVKKIDRGSWEIIE